MARRLLAFGLMTLAFVIDVSGSMNAKAYAGKTRLETAKSELSGVVERLQAELKARIARSVEFIKGLEASQIDGSEARDISMRMGGNDVSFKGQNYLMWFAMPNFMFHATTAYNILRHNGVAIGKRDYLGAA